MVNEDSVREIQEERLVAMLTMELREEEYRWGFLEDEKAEVLYDVGARVEEIVLGEVMEELGWILGRRNGY